MGLCVGAVLFVSGAWARYHNELVTLEVDTETRWKQVENALQRQHDLIPNLVKVTMAFAKHESGILERVAHSRTQLLSGGDAERVAVAGEIEGMVVNLLAISEAYPELKADQSYRDLRFELAGAQNRIAVERNRYNELVGIYNARLRMFPWVLASFGFSEKDFYTPKTNELTQPEIQL